MNNTKLDFPAIMSDGRSLTDYRSACILDIGSIVSKSDGERIFTNDLYPKSLKYRNFIQDNGLQIMKGINNDLSRYTTCTTCPDYTIIAPKMGQGCGDNMCTVMPIDEMGMGMMNDSIEPY
jgi:hypothetical protein